MNPNDDKRLIDSILGGEQADFAIVIERYQRLVAYLVARMIPKVADRDDLCQDIFIKVYRHLGEFQFRSKFSTWIATIAHNTCVNYLEKKRVSLYEDLQVADEDEASHGMEWIPSGDRSPLDRVEAHELRVTLEREIERIPLPYREILALFHLEEMSYEEIGTIMNLPEGTVKSYLFRARRFLRDRLLALYQMEAV